MTNSYVQLAPILDRIGLSARAAQTVSDMLDYAQRNDYFGRQITELGTGTGEGILTLDDAGYRLTALDNAPEMLAIAREKSSGIEWLEADIRKMNDILPDDQDMIVAVDVFNEMGSLRELQAIFKTVHAALRDNRMFTFDMYTIEGLTKRGTGGNEVIYDADGIFAMIENDYDYERQEATRQFITYQQSAEDDGWQRTDATRSLRAYPVSAIAALLQRVGFQEIAVFTARFQPLMNTTTERVIFTAVK